MRIPRCVGFELCAFVVMIAVDFDYEPMREAGKVDDVSVNWALPSEVMALPPQFTQPPPELRFCDCWVLAQSPGNLVGHDALLLGFPIVSSPHPQPLPVKGRGIQSVLPSAMAFKCFLSLFAGMSECSRRLSALRLEAGEFEEIGEQRVALFRGDAFRMELHAVHGMRLVLQAHDDAVRRLGGDFKAIG